MRLSNYAAATLAAILAIDAGPSCAQEGPPKIEPLNPMALEVAKMRCRDMSNASGNKSDESDCVKFAESEFAILDSYRNDPLMRSYIWGTCAEVSGYTSVATARTIGVFTFCSYKMMDRCNVGTGDGNQLDPIDCMRAIRTMSWLPSGLR